jgi:hypothetical protein
MAETKKKQTAELTLSTVEFDRPKLTIDGKFYEMVAAEELSPKSIRRLRILGRRITESIDPDREEEEGDDEAVRKASEEFTPLVIIGLEEEVMKKLRFMQHVEVAKLFTRLIGDEKSMSETD